MLDEGMQLLLEAKDKEIERLTSSNKFLTEKLFELVSSKPKKIEPKIEPKTIRRPMVIDKDSGKLREKTEAEASEEFKALQELGILA